MESNRDESKVVKKGIDFATKELQEKLTITINDSGLPPVITKYVLKDLLREVESIETHAIEMQSQEYLKETEEKDKIRKEENHE